MNAIILVAGMGTRLYPLTKNNHKSLLKINNESLLERQIKFLKEIGINDITIVVGYLSNKFNKLKTKYNLNVIFNKKYNIYNNIYSLYLAKDLLNETYILEGDVFYTNNPFKNNLKNSTYLCTKKSFIENEWVLNIDNNNKITNIEIKSSSNNLIMHGGAYMNKKNSLFIKNKLEELYKSNKKIFKTYFWDNIVLNHINEMDDIYAFPIDCNKMFEIDTIYEYYELKNLIEK